MSSRLRIQVSPSTSPLSLSRAQSDFNGSLMRGPRTPHFDGTRWQRGGAGRGAFRRNLALALLALTFCLALWALTLSRMHHRLPDAALLPQKDEGTARFKTYLGPAGKCAVEGLRDKG